MIDTVPIYRNQPSSLYSELIGSWIRNESKHGLKLVSFWRKCEVDWKQIVNFFKIYMFDFLVCNLNIAFSLNVIQIQTKVSSSKCKETDQKSEQSLSHTRMNILIYKTRKHSSGMHTARLFVFQWPAPDVASGGSSSEQVWTGLQCWPRDVSSRGLGPRASRSDAQGCGWGGRQGFGWSQV